MMKMTLIAWTVALLPLAASAAVSVEWVSPENFKDAYYTNVKSEKSRQIVLDDLEKFIVERASAKLKEGQSLDLKVTDVDLSGEFDPYHGGQENVRLVRAPFFASISFSYTLTDADGTVLKQGDEQLVNKLLLAPQLPYKDEIDPYLYTTMVDWINANL